MKKVLSFVLVLSLVLGSFSMAFAATSTTATKGLSDVKGNANEDAIQVAYDLGIVTGNPDGTYLPAKAVTRAEFAAMITRALAIPDSALAGYKTSKFTDTNGYGWAVPYLAFCNSKGIMLGDGAGNAMPGKTITVNEAITMVLRAIGYTSNSSELVGVWPANYVTKAQELSLYDDVLKDAVGVDKANAAQIIYNTLTVQKVAVNSDGKTDYLWDNKTKDEPTTLLTAGLNCTANKDEIVGVDFSYDDAAINIVGLLGAHGTSYVQKTGDKKVIAFTKEDSDRLVGHMDGDKFKVGDTKYSFANSSMITATHTAIKNGDQITNSAIRTLQDDITASDDGDVIINVELSGKTIKTVHSVVAWTATDGEKVSASDLTAIADKELLSGDFAKDDNDAIDTNGFELVGASSLSDIKADNVVYIYEDKAGDIRKVSVGTQTVTGTVEEIDDADVTVAGKVYTYYDHAGAWEVVKGDSDFPEAGDSVTLTLDGNGYVYDCAKTGSADTFAVIKGQVASNGIDNIKVKLYTSKDEDKTVYLDDAEDITLEKVNGLTSSGMTKTSVTTGAIIGYGLNKNGEVDTMNLNVVSASAAQLLTDKVVEVTAPGIGNKTLPVASDVVVFTKDADGYDIANIKDVELKTDITVDGTFQFILDKDAKKVVAMLVNGDKANNGNDDLYAVLNSLTTKANAAGDNVQRVVGFANGSPLDKLTAEKSTNNLPTSVTTVAAFKFKVNADGEVSKCDPAISAVDGTLTGGALMNDNTTIKIGTTWYSLAKDAVVYQAETKDGDSKVDKYTVQKPSALRESSNYHVWLYDFNTDKDHEGYEVAIFVKY